MSDDHTDHTTPADEAAPDAHSEVTHERDAFAARRPRGLLAHPATVGAGAALLVLAIFFAGFATGRATDDGHGARDERAGRAGFRHGMRGGDQMGGGMRGGRPMGSGGMRGDRGLDGLDRPGPDHDGGRVERDDEASGAAKPG